MKGPREELLGCPIDGLTFEESVAELLRRIERRQKTHVVFLNAAKVVACHRDPELYEAIVRADLVLADGKPLVWLGKLLGAHVPTRVNGTDLMERMLAEAEASGFRVYFLGARPEVLVAALGRVAARHPRLRIVGAEHGYFTTGEEPEIMERINASGADILFLGMSSPKKELWGHTHRQELTVPILQSVGGSFDVLAGLVKRAPGWMQRAGLEWLFRVAQEPRRLWRRYFATNLVFLWLALGALVRLGFRVQRSPSTSSAAVNGALDQTSPRVRLLAIGQRPPPYHGQAVANQLVMESEEIRRAFEVSLLDTRDPRGIENIGRLDLGNVYHALRHGLRFLWLLFRFRPAIVYLPISQTTLPFLRDCLFLVPSRWLRKRVVVHLHGAAFGGYYRDASRPVRWLIRYALARVARVIVLGESLVPLFEGIVPRDRIAVVANGVPDPLRGGPIPSRPGRPLKVLYLGSLSREKGIFDLLAAASLVRKEEKELRFLLAGEWYRPEERALAQRLLAQDGLGDAVQMLGPVGPAEKARLLIESDLLVLPSYNEGHPLVLLEAMGAALPVVVTDVGCNRETVRDGMEGYLVAPGQVHALAARILALARDPALRHRLGRAARQRMLPDFTAESFVRRVQASLQAVMTSPGPHRSDRRRPEPAPITSSSQGTTPDHREHASL